MEASISPSLNSCESNRIALAQYGAGRTVDDPMAATAFTRANSDWPVCDSLPDEKTEPQRHRGRQWPGSVTELLQKQVNGHTSAQQVDQRNDPPLFFVFRVAGSRINRFAELVTQQLKFQLADCSDTSRVNCSQQSLNTIQQPVGVVEVEGTLMGPAISECSQFGNQASMSIWKRITHRPITVGPRECRRCHRIIYGTTCPYCANAILFDSHEFRLGDMEASITNPERTRDLKGTDHVNATGEAVLSSLSRKALQEYLSRQLIATGFAFFPVNSCRFRYTSAAADE